MPGELFTTAAAEGAEAEFMYRFVAMAPPPVRTRLGIAVERIGGGVAMSVRNDVTGYFSKALGFGFAEPVTADLTNRVLGFYEQHGSPGATLQIAPEVLPEDWDDICAVTNCGPTDPGGSWHAQLRTPPRNRVICGSAR